MWNIKKHNKLVNLTGKETDLHMENQWGAMGVREWYRLLGIRQAHGCAVQHGEYSQYFVIINGK